MSDDAPSPITNVADTAFWVAAARARESERPDALFHDPYARLLAGERGASMLEKMGRQEALSWSITIRTRVLDEMIMRCVEQDGCDTILNLAAGLDSRPYRLALPASLHWIEVDLPALLSYKEEVLANEHSACALERVNMDLAERPARQELLRRINDQATHVLVLTEGLLTYLTEEQVSLLLEDVHTQPNFHWVLNTSGPAQVMRYLQRLHGRQLARGGVNIQFMPEDENALFRRCGWEVAAFRSMFTESQRFKRALPVEVLELLSGPSETREAFYQRAGMTLYRRA